jgi:hypothetical protein
METQTLTNPTSSKPFVDTENKYAVIGAGPAGITAAKNLKENGIAFDGYEASSDVGGLWNIKNEYSTVYESAHLISSKKMTELKDFPMDESVADYPSHKEVFKYFKSYADYHKLGDNYYFNRKIVSITPAGDKWLVKTDKGEGNVYKGVLIANGCLSCPNMPNIPGKFEGELMHSSQYKTADIFEGKRVLVVGAGNSGCDIVVDAVHRAARVDLSVRRGYHFVPKYLFGKPADSIGGKVKLPYFLKQKVDKFLLKTFFVPDPQKYGFPKPDHDIYESHPIVNTLVLHHLGHGDINMKGDVVKFEGKKVFFTDGSSEEYDLVLLSTGYKLSYPFIDGKHLNWKEGEKAPQLYLNIFTPQHDNLFVLGMVEATGLGWHGRDDQGKLVAKYIKAKETNPDKAKKLFDKVKAGMPDLRGGFKYMEVDRMAFYVHKETYLNALVKHLELLN